MANGTRWGFENDLPKLHCKSVLLPFAEIIIEGKLTSSKWARIKKCSPDTALRDVNELTDQGVLQKDPGGGRSTSYALIEIAD